MTTTPASPRRGVALLVAAVLAGAGCNSDALTDTPGADLGAARADFTVTDHEGDLAAASESDLAAALNECGDREPTCATEILAPPFPLRTDPQPTPGVEDEGLKRDINGALVLDVAMRQVVDAIWVGSSNDLNGSGSVSRYDARAIREVARYRSVTCFSNKTGSTANCDGQNGCCAADDWSRYQARSKGQAEPGRQAVQSRQNAPSRTAIDWRGDMFIANQAFGSQSSVTRIAANVADCIDRNRNGRIDTSSDTNGNGVIETDCNGNNQPDNLADVQGKPCDNNLAQEFYGEDDECILWTTNTFPNNQIGRSLATVVRSGGKTEVWAGSYLGRGFAQLDPATGRIGADTVLPQACSVPFAALADTSGIVWVGPLSNGKLCWFDSARPATTGVVRDPQWGGLLSYGLAIDRDANVWVGSTVARYTPDRSNGTSNLGSGWWTRFGPLSGVGIAADSRNAKDYFVYSCVMSSVVQIPASAFPAQKKDQEIADAGWPRINMPCMGVGLDASQNVWGVNGQSATRALVDKNGGITQPVVNGQPMGNAVCPAGDSCRASGTEVIGEFTGFNPVRAAGPANGRYARILTNPNNCTAMGRRTRWLKLSWEADAPASTTVGARVRTGPLSVIDNNWSAWSDAGSTPAAVGVEGNFIQVEFQLASSSPGTTPSLRSFSVVSECF